jgi:hypothetical protein
METIFFGSNSLPQQIEKGEFFVAKRKLSLFWRSLLLESFIFLALFLFRLMPHATLLY